MHKTWKCPIIWFFWRQTVAFRSIQQRDYRPGKACILYQKFIAPNSYLYVGCFTDEQREKVRSVVESVMSDEEAKGTVDLNLFDEMIQVIEEKMVDGIFMPFFVSNFFKQYLQSSKLDKGFVMQRKISKSFSDRIEMSDIESRPDRSNSTTSSSNSTENVTIVVDQQSDFF